jgi:putative lipase involved disintegration of autophagic bodies
VSTALPVCSLHVLVQSGKKIKSITITGHSLGGALASMCGFDLATAIQEARTGTSVALPGSRYLADNIKNYVKNSPYLPAAVADNAAALSSKFNPIVSAASSCLRGQCACTCGGAQGFSALWVLST